MQVETSLNAEDMKRLGEAIDNAHRDQALKLLANPVAVHVNMLRGIIAKPSWQAIEHLYPEASALAAERDAATARAEAAERERDALRDEWEEIAAGITTEQPEVGALWPLVSEVSGNLAAARNLFRNEVVAHNRTKAERDRMKAALEKAAIAAEVESAGHAIAIIEAALTSAKEPSA